jgi:hypothetical protein
MLFPLLAVAAAPVPVQSVTLTLKDHRFQPDKVAVRTGEPIDVVLTDKDGTPEEFDSEDLGVEEVVHPGQTIRFRIGPLKPGSYSFMGEHHADTAAGVIVSR